MALPSPPSFATEAALAFQHMDRIIAALKDGSTAALQGVVVWTAGSKHLEQGRIAWNAYSQVRFRTIDLVRLTYGNVVKDAKVQDVPAIIVAAKSLPKAAMIEVQVLAYSNRQSDQDEDDDDEAPAPVGINVTSNRSEHHASSTRKVHDNSSFSMILIRNTGKFVQYAFVVTLTFCLLGIKRAIKEATTVLRNQRVLSIKVFHTSSAESESVQPFYDMKSTFNNRHLAEQLYPLLTGLACTHIPVRGIASSDRQPWDLALCIHSIPGPRI
jgi:enamine deaminase RidA (YjgF/YER057c/UK114 family)